MAQKDYSDKEVKKRATVDLTGRWWNDAWPGDTPPSSHGRMQVALKTYHAAKRKTSRSDLETALNDLKTAAAAVRRDAVSKLKATPKRKDAMIKDIITFEGIVEKELKTLKDFGSKSRVVYRRDFGEAVEAQVKKKTKEPFDLASTNALIVEHELLDAVIDEIEEKNALGMLNMEYNYCFDDQVKKCAKAVASILEERKGRYPKKTDQMVAAEMSDHFNTMQELQEKVPTKLISKLGLNASMEAAYKKKLNQRRKKIALSSVMTGAAGAAVALPGTQGFAIYGLARSAASLTQQIIEHNMNVKQKALALEKQLSFLTTTFTNAQKKTHGPGRAISETGGTTLNALLGVDIMPTLDKATSNYKNLKLHIAHAGFKAQKLTGMINNMLVEANKLESEWKTSRDKMSDRMKKKMYQQIINSRAVLDAWLDKTHAVISALRIAEKKLPALALALKNLGKNTKAQNGVNLGSKVVVGLVGIAVGGLADASVAVQAAETSVTCAEKVAAIAISTEGVIEELYGTVKEVKDLAAS